MQIKMTYNIKSRMKLFWRRELLNCLNNSATESGQKFQKFIAASIDDQFFDADAMGEYLNEYLIESIDKDEFCNQVLFFAFEE